MREEAPAETDRHYRTESPERHHRPSLVAAEELVHEARRPREPDARGESPHQPQRARE